MQPDTRRYLIVLLLLALGAGAAAAIQVYQHTALEPGPVEPAAALYIVHTDVAGWYATTPDERAVTCLYDPHLEALAQALPYTLGTWRGTDLGNDAELAGLYDHPDVVTRRVYANTQQRRVWLTVIGSRGAKSFRLFEHTPEICYVSAGWTPVRQDVVRVTLQGGELPVKRGEYVQADERQVMYAWYQFDGPARDPAQGISTWRLATDAKGGDPEAVLTSFLRLLFLEVLPWRRF